jgi:high-affinity iron transporter
VGATFVITLREGFEAALLLGIVCAYLDKIGRPDGRRFVAMGGILGLAAAIAVGAALLSLSGPLVDVGPDVLGAAVIFAAVALLTWHTWWMRRHARALKGDLQRRIDDARASQRLWIVGLIAFTGVFREGAETVLFLWGLMTQVSEAGWMSVAGGAAGLVAAGALGWAIFRGGRRISLPRFFAATSVLLILLAAGLFSTGVGRLQGLGVLPQASAVWDTSAWLDDRGVVGGFLAGLIGYRATPSALEVAAYAAYLAVMLLVLFPRAARSESASTADATRRKLA